MKVSDPIKSFRASAKNAAAHWLVPICVVARRTESGNSIPIARAAETKPADLILYMVTP